MKNFGTKIKDARKAKHLTQKELAKILNVAHNSVSDWENGKSKPDPDVIALICGVLDLTPNYLMEVSDDEYSPTEKLLIRQYRMLSSYSKETIRIIMDRELNRKEEHTEKVLHLPYYGKVASAGTPIESFSILMNGVISVIADNDSEKASYAIGVSGDSMEPVYCDSDIVLVQKCYSVNIGDIGIFRKANDIYIKECTENGLRSFNPDYKDMIDEIETECLGKVICKAKVIS